jgi:Asp-tRNA(Asn)/Glu-tRNA(Gln) amidotransferase A subunit family amidase
MDKIGPICRTAEDCAIVFDAIYGPDGKDAAAADITFNFDADLDVRKLRVGYLKTDFERDRGDKQWQKNDMATLDTLGGLGINLVEIKLPDYPVSAMNFILNAEAAAAFSQLTLSGQDDMLVRQVKDAWPNVFRKARMIPAVEYIQANRLRTLTIQAMAKIMADIDVYLAPSWVGDNLLLTNLTGHPAVVLPNGFKEDATPTSITFNGRLYGEAQTLALAKAYQDATDFHLKHPKLKG